MPSRCLVRDAYSDGQVHRRWPVSASRAGAGQKGQVSPNGAWYRGGHARVTAGERATPTRSLRSKTSSQRASPLGRSVPRGGRRARVALRSCSFSSSTCSGGDIESSGSGRGGSVWWQALSAAMWGGIVSRRTHTIRTGQGYESSKAWMLADMLVLCATRRKSRSAAVESLYR